MRDPDPDVPRRDSPLDRAMAAAAGGTASPLDRAMAAVAAPPAFTMASQGQSASYPMGGGVRDPVVA